MRFDDIQAPHALRAAEVALAGGHSIVFIGSADSPADDLAELVNEQGLWACSWDGTGPMPTADICVEVSVPKDQPRGEPHEQIMGRITNALLVSPEPTEGLSVQAEALLALAARQLDLSDDQVTAVREITATIARLAGSDRMDTAFLCEALQYQPRRGL